MAYLKKIIFFTLFLNLLDLVILADTPQVINTCGNILGRQPSSAEECIEEGEICCYVSLLTPDNQPIKFCVSSPSDIEKEDVEGKIKEYTGFTLVDIHCNRGSYISNYFSSLLFIFILFICNI